MTWILIWFVVYVGTDSTERGFVMERFEMKSHKHCYDTMLLMQDGKVEDNHGNIIRSYWACTVK